MQTDGEQKKKRGRPRKNSLETEGEKSNEIGKKQKIAQPTREPCATRSRKIADTSFVDISKITTVSDEYTFPDLKDEFTETKNKNVDEILHCFYAEINNDPFSFEQAMNSLNKNEWLDAIKEEFNSLEKNEVVDRPLHGKNGKKPNIIDSRWVLKQKLDSSGSIKYKARLVIRGFKDSNSYDLKETYAPVSRLTLVRTVLAMINYYDLEVCQLDVKTAFLNGTIEDEIFMEIPDGMNLLKEIRQSKVCKLHRSLYGLRISPKRWNERFSAVAKTLGLVNDDYNPCLFTCRSGNSIVILLIYVDDILLRSNDSKKLIEVKNQLQSSFEMTDLGEPKVYLGMTIKRQRETKTMTVTQEAYIGKVLSKFRFADKFPKNTPMVTRQVGNRERRERENDENDLSEDMLNIPYREMIGCLLYLSGATRPDIAFAINVLSRHQINPTENEYSMLKRVFQYLKGTKELGLKYVGRRSNLLAYSDASFADCIASISTCGYVIRLFGDTISWRANKQTYVALSTCQAEYVAMSQACQEIMAINKSIVIITEKSLLPATLKCDNRAATICAQTSGGNRLRHMTEVHEDYVKECAKYDRVVIQWVSTKYQLADNMTKPLSYETHVGLQNKILNHDS